MPSKRKPLTKAELAELLFEPGDQVSEGSELLRLER